MDHSGAQITVVAHVIQQAVAPVFLLTGVGAILSVLTNRLARIVDRHRTVDAFLAEIAQGGSGAQDAEHRNAAFRRNELANLKQRRTLIHHAITLCTVCALLVCVVIATLFVAAELNADPSRIVGALFVTAMLSLITGLLCFLREIALATRAFDRAEAP